MSERVLLVEDDPILGDSIASAFREEGFTCTTVQDAERAVPLLARDRHRVLMTDLRLPGMSGLELLRETHQLSPNTVSIVMSAFGCYDTALEALRLGAADLVQKPVNFPDLVKRVRSLLRSTGAPPPLRSVQHPETALLEHSAILGASRQRESLLKMLRKLERSTSTVLVTGESGTGKELVARTLHRNNAETRAGRFVPVNCAAIPEMLLESELFGHVRGSFTGASADKMGLIEAASGGTLFLDEIGEMSLPLQAKLLRVLELKEIQRVGGLTPIPVRVRIICSTHRDLKQMVEQGKFREDLYYRIDVVNIHLPPLRERPEDIPVLAAHFVRRLCLEMNRPEVTIDVDAMKSLIAFPWKGNVRELENVIERALVLSESPTLTLSDLRPEIAGIPGRTDPIHLREALQEFERRHVSAVLGMTDGNRVRAAHLLGVSPSTLYRRLSEFEAGDVTPDPVTRGV